MEKQQEAVRTRFAPSPTGFLHVGGVRTALFAWLVAKQNSGQFILRIEDTDRSRHVEESEAHIQESLKWLGLEWDEGPIRQSERLNTYQQWAQKLIKAGRAYTDPYSPQELERLRQKAHEEKRPFLFRDHRPEAPVEWREGLPLRFKSEPKSYQWRDEVMGELSTGPEVVDDFIIIKSDGFPTYNFAHIVDDHETKISHVIRSQEFLSSVPKFLNLYEAMGVDRPKLATLPYVLGPDGKKKLSKRDGAKDILDYRREGYLPEALVSFLATLGWNDGTTQEIYSREELIKKFSLNRVQRHGAKFDEERLEWVNGHFIREIETDKLYERSWDFWPPEAKDFDEEIKKRILEIEKARIKKLSDLSNISSFFFNAQSTPRERAKEVAELFEKYREGSSDPKPDEWLKTVTNLINAAASNDPRSYEESLKVLIDKTSGQPLTLYGSLRVALTGAPQTPTVWETIYALGREESIKRLEEVAAALDSQA
jgi:glutamyl-tRNA synthetase